MRWRKSIFSLSLVCVLSATAARADEIHLKDGSKIVGNIVGFEDGSFKVETAYGFAMVRKDSIQEIVPSAPAKAPDGAAKPAKAKENSKQDASVEPESGAPNSQTSASQAKLAGAAQAPVSGHAAVKAAATSPKSNDSSIAAPRATSAATATGVTPQPTPIAAPSTSAAAEAAAPVAVSIPASAPAPRPVEIKETVHGNLYVNQTYGFSIYCPPGWDIMADSRAAMPEAITALGTLDHSSLLAIGRDTQGGTIDARASATQRKLRDIYDNFRPLLTRSISVAGLPAKEQRFRGTADGHDWSVIAVTLERGNEVFTVLGMTYADSDLIQIQENVLAKEITSLQFTAAQ